MLRRFARGVALGVLLACQGCPAPTPPAPVATPVPAPLAAVALPAFAGDAPALADPGPGVTPEATYAATDTGAPSEVVPSERVETLGTGAVLEPAGRLALGLAGYYERDGVRRARLSAAEGQVCLEYLLGPGERARVGQAVFRLEASQGRSAALRWERAFADPERTPQLLRELDRPLDAPGALRLEEMGLYRFSDGRVLAVGNVVPGASPAVTVCVYPASYERDPMLGYDRHFLGTAGSTLAGEHATLQLAEVTPGAGDAWGSALVQARR